VVLGHGFGGSARNFRPQARFLASVAQVVLFDARGHARSDAPPDAASYRPSSFVADLSAILDGLRVRRAIVGGLSMGAGIALRFTLEHPERVAGLALSAFPRAVDEPEHVPWALEFARSIERDGLDVAGERAIWGRFDGQARELIRQGFLEHQPQALAHVLRELIAIQPAPAAIPGLESIRAPTAVIVGALDGPSLGPCRTLGRRIPGAELSEVAGAGHVVNLSHAAEYNRILSRLVERARSRGEPS